MTPTRIFEFASLVLLAICLMPAAAHFFEMPGKMGMSMDAYFAVQPIYNGWAMFGIPLVLAIVSIAILTWLLRETGVTAWLAGASAALLLASLGWFFIRIYPTNVATKNWTIAPDNWEAMRAQWESGHAANALITFAAFFALVLVAVIRS